MVAYINTVIRTVVLDAAMKGEDLIKVLDFLFPEFEWKKYTIRIEKVEDMPNDEKAPRVSVNRFKHKGLHPWNEGYQLMRTTSGGITTKAPTAKSKVSTNVLAQTRTNPRLVYDSYFVSISDG